MSETASPSRRGRFLRIAAGFTVLLALAGYLVVRLVPGDGGPPRCVARATDSSDGDVPTYEMSPEQAANAATISAVGTTRGMPERAVTIALATALQESALRNIDHGDRDSVGLFQQRPSKGWGTVEQILDPVYSAGKFYAGLAEVPGYSRLPLTEAAQRVQRSGFPQAYAKHEPDATLLSAALTGRAAATLTCTGGSDGEPGDPAKVRAALTRAFGPEVLPKAGSGDAPADGGGEREGQAGGEAAGQPDAKGPAEVAVLVGGSDEARGWELAHWAVAHSADLRIAEVSVGDRVWSVEKSGQGWRKTDGESGPEKSGGNAVRMRIAQ
ncbi:hypothetical protein [Streptomyces sp. NPDC058665]|uniref:hypothetical protein n=1 Tax=Streptomyces sp. NPDC058665 TaxID=3346586 RepID=UPI0036635DBD